MAALRPEDIPASAQAAFLKLQAKFCLGLPKRWAQIEQANTPTACAECLHRLAGAAGSYGYPDLSQLAYEALALAQASDKADACPEGFRDKLQSLMLCMHATAARTGN